jgi:hypothetical protein
MASRPTALSRVSERLSANHTQNTVPVASPQGNAITDAERSGNSGSIY